MKLDGKVILITGASGGIGAACVEAFRKRGARLALTGRTQSKLEQLAGNDSLAIAADLTGAAARVMIIERTVAHYGRVDVLINNAGIGLYAPSYESMDLARSLFELNFFAALDMARQVIPVMRKQRSGMIVNVSSIAGQVTLPWMTLYSASKHALGSLTDGLRMELRRDGIHAMSVCPGYVDTAFQSHVLAGEPPRTLPRKRPLSITASQCAEAIARGMERNACTVMTPAAGWFLAAAARVFPRPVERRLEQMYTSR